MQYETDHDYSPFWHPSIRKKSSNTNLCPSAPSGDKTFINRGFQFCFSLSALWLVTGLLVPNPDHCFTWSEKGQGDILVGPRFQGYFSNWMFLARLCMPEGRKLGWLWAHVCHKLPRPSSRIHFVFNSLHTFLPEAEGWIVNLLIQFCLQRWRGQEAPLAYGIRKLCKLWLQWIFTILNHYRQVLLVKF